MLNLHKHNGFTLVELIIALSILSFVMVLCASSFKFGSRVWERVDYQSSHIDSLQAVQSFLRNSISHALVKDKLRDDGFEDERSPALDVGSLFIGKPQHLKFISYSPQYGVDDYLYEYQLYFDEQNKSLSIHYAPYNLNAENTNQPLSIIEGVKSLDIRYFSGFYSDDGKTSWLARWDDEYSLPLLIKINVKFVDDSLQWPELIIPTRHGAYVVR